MADSERAQSPEERELDLKRTELAGLESELVERELELSTHQQELAVFQADYLRVVGRRYAMLDDINARIAEAQAVRRPDDHGVLRRARDARETADLTAVQAESDAPDEAPAARFEPAAGLKALYRAAARKLHPDLATTDDERARRHEWMAKVNEAYRHQNEDTLKTVLTDWETSPESVPGTGIPSELVRVIRQIAQVRRRIDEIGLVVDALKAGDMYALYAQCRTQPTSAGNPMDELAARIDDQIADAKRRLANLKAESRPPDVLESRNDGDTDTGAETNGGGAPIEERYEEIQQLILLGKERGYLLFDEVNELLPDEITSSEELGQLFNLFGNADIEVVESRQQSRKTERTERTERDDQADGVADWFLRDVDSGHADAQFRLGKMFANGEGQQERDAELGCLGYSVVKMGSVLVQYVYLFLIALVGLASAYGGVYTADWLSTILCDEGVCGVASGLAVVGGFLGGWLAAMAVLGGSLAFFRRLVRALLSR